ncbi:kinase-like domain-containing protein [Fomitopsis serialis]|uniref:kinase-like domain-containing protein n=1 Tax=Fomitopsis serialis TaxID=139415 RepID=UPI0020074115|nr:kinase-like domain-containing protein [Neoantrodia serialis]XP_047886061.1 kinase-like domain-containing protein [Neoantrodia serialis]KAH9911869.1 kinase-like domain-containing protein [Neoantrodia serialis]KAH9913533.1 kinase-like domain-containing protein [Neoantrodia serialis]
MVSLSPGSAGRPKSDYAPSEIDDLTDEEIEDLIGCSAQKYPERIAFGDHHITRVTDTIVSKFGQDVEEDVAEPSEALTLDLVFRHTTIPVPRVRRIIRDPIGITLILMDYIPGRQLSVVWPTMSLEERLCVVFTLRDYVRQLQAVRHPRSAVPGPVAPGDEARTCESPVWGQLIERRGPFTSYRDFSIWCDRAQRVGIDLLKKKPRWTTSDLRFEPFDTIMGSSPFVLCHQDLNMRNIIVGDDGRLWLVDWAWAGFYPPWFEYISMKEQSENEESVMHRKEPFWDLMIPFICRPYYREERWLQKVMPAFLYKFERDSRNLAEDYRTCTTG